MWPDAHALLGPRIDQRRIKGKGRAECFDRTGEVEGSRSNRYTPGILLGALWRACVVTPGVYRRAWVIRFSRWGVRLNIPRFRLSSRQVHNTTFRPIRRVYAPQSGDYRKQGGVNAILAAFLKQVA
jgi:hypothetical protein